jgi:apolipoprotein N-acyltransferase
LTPYARTGNVPVIALCVFWLLVGLLAARVPRRALRRGRVEPTI